jgi:hypothetical protein
MREIDTDWIFNHNTESPADQLCSFEHQNGFINLTEQNEANWGLSDIPVDPFYWFPTQDEPFDVY